MKPSQALDPLDAPLFVHETHYECGDSWFWTVSPRHAHCIVMIMHRDIEDMSYSKWLWSPLSGLKLVAGATPPSDLLLEVGRSLCKHHAPTLEVSRRGAYGHTA